VVAGEVALGVKKGQAVCPKTKSAHSKATDLRLFPGIIFLWFQIFVEPTHEVIQARNSTVGSAGAR